MAWPSRLGLNRGHWGDRNGNSAPGRPAPKSAPGNRDGHRDQRPGRPAPDPQSLREQHWQPGRDPQTGGGAGAKVRYGRVSLLDSHSGATGRAGLQRRQRRAGWPA